MNKNYYLGIDTSNYRTSVAVCDGEGNTVASVRQLLRVAEGERGLRQSDALFLHTVALPGIMTEIGKAIDDTHVSAVGYSAYPRDVEGSYMPCFLAGKAIAESIAALNGIPAYPFSHQAGHVRAAAYSCGGVKESPDRFISFHVSGGTTEILLYDSGNITLLGGSEDLHAGQLIDRVGVAMGMPFPCGEEMERLAESVPAVKGIKTCVRGLNCNLSGIENQAIDRFRKGEPRETVAAFTLDAVLKTLEKLSENVRELYPDLPILYAGGVMSCKRLQSALSKRKKCHFATPELSGDNAVGVALLAMDQAAKEL